MSIALLTILGLCFGSFINALVWRIHEQSKAQSSKLKARYSIVNGRSMCIHCKHELGFFDLLPVISWVILKGRCRYCKKSISPQYPVVELLTALLFITSYIFWPNNIEGSEVITFSLWLIILTGLIALAIYDLKWMLLPNKILYPLYLVALAYVLLIAFQSENVMNSLADIIMAIAIGGGIFYLLFQASKGKWIGGGDVKLGFLLGALVIHPLNAMVMLFFASIFGLLFSLPLVSRKKTVKSVKIPFGPFLILGCIITVLFGTEIIDWYTSLISI